MHGMAEMAETHASPCETVAVHDAEKSAKSATHSATVCTVSVKPSHWCTVPGPPCWPIAHSQKLVFSDSLMLTIVFEPSTPEPPSPSSPPPQATRARLSATPEIILVMICMLVSP